MTRAVSVEQLLRRPVVLNGIRLGRPRDVVFDLDVGRAVGLEVECGDTRTRFLPFAASRVHETEIAVRSSLVLLEEADVSFYRARGRTFLSLVGAAVHRDGEAVGELVDLCVGGDGTVEAASVRAAGAVRLLPAGPSLTFGPAGSASAA